MKKLKIRMEGTAKKAGFPFPLPLVASCYTDSGRIRRAAAQAGRLK